MRFTFDNAMDDGRRARVGRALWLALLCGALAPAAAFAQTPARCGFSFGFSAGAGAPTDRGLRKEFPYAITGNSEVKYYLWNVLSLAGDIGFIYETGQPDVEELGGRTVSITGHTRAYMRSGTADLLLRAEIGRYWRFNPYVGGGAGGMLNSATRYGLYNGKSVTDNYDEVLWHFVALVGFDYLFDKYVAIKFEARWTFAPTQNLFDEKRDIGLWYGLVGVQIYL